MSRLTNYELPFSSADDYTPLAAYTSSGNAQSAPLRSAIKLKVPPGGDKYFNSGMQFQSRVDNYRIPPPAATPVVIDDGNVNVSKNGVPLSYSGEYSRNANAYKISQY